MKHTHSVLRAATALASAALSLLLASSPVQAHWCDDMWVSSYNIVVRPESSTVTVPASGTGTMTIYVQNNMGYLLPSFTLGAKVGNTDAKPTLASTLKVADTLLPGEKAKYTLTVSKSGGGTVSIQDITFSVSFSGGESHCYASTSGSKPVMVVNPDGTLFPAATPLPGLDTPSCADNGQQSNTLQYSATADFENEASGLDKLMTLYCAGRASWNSGSSAVVPSYCPNSTTTGACPTTKPGNGTGSKYDYNHLWAAGELAARKSGLGTRLAPLRTRLQCGANDGDLGFAGFAMLMLGYLGQDTGAQTFLKQQVAAGGDVATVAKAALYVMGYAADKTAYAADVKAGLTASNFFAKMACAAALGIADHDDASVTSTLIPNVKWTEPDTDDDGKGMFASHLIALVAWDRRGWAVNGGDTGGVSFYGDTGTTGAGGATPAGGTTGAGGTTAGTGGATGSNGGATGSKGGTTGSSAGATGSNAGATGSNGGGTGSKGGATGSNGGTLGSNGGAIASNGGSTGSNGGAIGSNGGATGINTISDDGGASGSNGGATGSPTTTPGDPGKGCSCNLGTRSQTTPGLYVLVSLAIGWIAARRRRR